MADKKQTKDPKANKATASTQRFLDIAEIREDTVILKDGTMRMVMLVSSINFALKSEDEQNAIIQGYISFLNSIDFTLQIVVQSRRLNIQGYLDKLSDIEKQQTNDLLRMQVTEYRQFIGELVELGEIMNKKFFVVVPYDPVSDTKRGFFARLKTALTPASVIKLSDDRFKKQRHELLQRVDHTIAGLNSMGLEAVVLDTQSLIELYYNTYNPEVADLAPLVDINELQLDSNRRNTL